MRTHAPHHIASAVTAKAKRCACQICINGVAVAMRYRLSMRRAVALGLMCVLACRKSAGPEEVRELEKERLAPIIAKHKAGASARLRAPVAVYKDAHAVAPPAAPEAP